MNNLQKGALGVLGLVVVGGALASQGGEDPQPQAAPPVPAVTVTETRQAEPEPEPQEATEPPRTSAAATPTAAPASISPQPAVTQAPATPQAPASTKPRLTAQPETDPPARQAPAKVVNRETSGTYYKNCTAAKKAGVAPLYRGDPGYRKGLDRDSDGVACEK